MSNRGKRNRRSGERYLSRADVIRSCGCDQCGAAIGQPCTGKLRNGRPRLSVHKQRLIEAERLNR